MQCFEDNKKSSSLCHIRLLHMENPQEIHSLFDKFAVAGYPIALPDKFHESLLECSCWFPTVHPFPSQKYMP